MTRILTLPELEKEAYDGWSNASLRLYRLPENARLRRWFWTRSTLRWQRSLDEIKELRRKVES